MKELIISILTMSIIYMGGLWSIHTAQEAKLLYVLGFLFFHAYIIEKMR